MKKTRRLFYEDVYTKEFEARVLACLENAEGDAGQTADASTRSYRILLDQTAFYPEGGGQPADLGCLGMVNKKAMESGIGAESCEISPEAWVNVTDVQEDGELIWHTTDGSLEVGSTVKGVVDWNRRFELMQLHAGEHIVSGLIHNRYGYDNVGFHMGEEFVTIDVSGLLDESQLKEIEAEANAYIWQDKAVEVSYPSREECKRLPYRSKKEIEGQVRLVGFPGADLCACCGTHVTHTGEIGLVKLISVHKFRQGVRIEMLCGKRAWEYMNAHVDQNSQIAVALSVKPDQTKKAVDRMEAELFELKGQLRQLKQLQYDKLSDSCEGKGDVFHIERDMEPADLRKCADRILNRCGGICVLMSGTDEVGYQYAIGERDGDVRALVKEVNQRFSGRGGGKPPFAQGKLVGCEKDIRSFFVEKGFLLA